MKYSFGCWEPGQAPCHKAGDIITRGRKDSPIYLLSISDSKLYMTMIGRVNSCKPVGNEIFPYSPSAGYKLYEGSLILENDQ